MSDSIRRLLAEFLGTLILIFTGSLAILAFGGSDEGVRLVGVALASGLGLLAALHATGEVSGGHYNPAVSLAAWLDRRIDGRTLGGYAAVQVLGATAASLIVLVGSSQSAVVTTVTVAAAGTGTAILMEVALTAIFVMVILQASVDGLGSAPFLAIALTLVMILLVASPFSGASVNPARSLGPAIVGRVGADLWIYLVFPFVGGALGWCLHRLVTVGAISR